MSLIDEIDITASFLERHGFEEGARLQDVARLRLEADGLPGEPAPAAPPPVEGDHLAPGSILRLQETGDTVTITSWDGAAYHLSNGKSITDQELDALTSQGLVSVLSPEGEAAMETGLAAADEIARVDSAASGLLAGAVARMVEADLSGDPDVPALTLLAEAGDQIIEIPDFTSPTLPAKIRDIVDAHADDYDVLKHDDGGWSICLPNPGASVVNGILQDAANAGIAAWKGGRSEGWLSIEFGELAEGAEDGAVPAILNPEVPVAAGKALRRLADGLPEVPEAPAAPPAPAAPSGAPGGPRQDATLVLIRRPDGAVYHLPMMVVQRALEMGYSNDLRKLFAGATEVHVLADPRGGLPSMDEAIKYWGKDGARNHLRNNRNPAHEMKKDLELKKKNTTEDRTDRKLEKSKGREHHPDGINRDQNGKFAAPAVAPGALVEFKGD